jgi:ATP-dependent exoDNAse (exonuclease V) beta subunit
VRYAIHPSAVADDVPVLPQARVVSKLRFTGRIPFTQPANASWDQIGTALHAFLAADRNDLAPNKRLELGRAILSRDGLDTAFEPTALVSASDALMAFVHNRWPNARWHRELPVRTVLDTQHGRRCIQGTIDLLLETTDGFVVVDHKSFPGRSDLWAEQALKHAPQLLLYAMALKATGHVVLGHWVHFTVGGGAVEVQEA